MIKKYIASLTACAAISSICASPLFYANSFLEPRSQSVNAARELVGWRQFINRGDMDGFYNAFYALAEYSQSYRPNRIAEYFFNQQFVTISGSMNTNRTPDDFLADYFGLSPSFISDVAMYPRIKNSLVELNWYAGYKQWYFRIHVPFVHCTTHYPLRETINNNGEATEFPALYMDGNAIPAPSTSFTQSIESNNVIYGQITEGLNFSRIACAQHRSGVAEPQLAIGYNFIADDLSHVGFNVRCSVPTGNRSHARFLFEPMVGNGHHWEFGLGFTGHWTVWEKDYTQNLAVYLDINLTHLFEATQTRSFDFKSHIRVPCTNHNNFGSRYILVKEFDEFGTSTGAIFPAVNVTTLPCKVHNDLQLDLAFMLGYSSRWVDLDIGYGAWVRSREKIELCRGLPANRYGLKGIQNAALALDIPSAVTQSNATLNGNYFTDQAAVADADSPVFVNTSDLNIHSAANPTAFTNKLFWNLSHSWEYSKKRICHIAIPFVGFGGQAEFESLNPRRITDPNQIAISQWALWVKGGVAF